ncbi:MAG: prenyltransferase/squalene oxidase repeat-containing protein [Planctomycetota bacterium]
MRSVSLFFSCALLCCGSLAAQDPVRRDISPGDRHAELTPEAHTAIRQGVKWLVRNQARASGAWSCSPTNYRMSVTSLAGLALLAHGDTPDDGPHAEAVRSALKFVIRNQRGKDSKWPGLLFDVRPGRETKDDRPMHGHGFALLFLGEAYGMPRDPVLRRQLHDCLAQAARLTERSISPDGGWCYFPDSRRDEGSVTITQIQGLRSANDGGVLVDRRTIERAVEYIKNSQQSDGGVRYMLNYGKTTPALTAAGISVLHGSGEYYSDAIERGYGYLRKHLKIRQSDQQFFYYTHFYVAQAMFQRGGAEWAAYFPKIRDELLDLRRGRQYWEQGNYYGPAYETAFALLILEVPLRYLPVFQR